MFGKNRVENFPALLRGKRIQKSSLGITKNQDSRGVKIIIEAVKLEPGTIDVH